MRLAQVLTLGAALTGCPKTEPAPVDAGPQLASRCQPGEEWLADSPAFTNQTASWGLTALAVRGTRMTVLDYNHDGWPDLLVRRGAGPDTFEPGGERQRWLLKNTGAGSFVDVTEASGLFTDRAGAEGALRGDVIVAGDVNNDGLTDVFIAAASDDGSVASELRLGTAEGGFRFAAETSDARRAGVTSVPSGLSLTDVDRDGYIDLWMTQNKTGTQASPMADGLYFGDGAGGFQDLSATVGVQTRNWASASVPQLNNAEGNSWSWGATACDLDGNGVPDLLSPSYGRAPNHLWLGSETTSSVAYINHSVASGYAYDPISDWSDNESARCWCQLNPGDAGCGPQVPQPRINCQENSDAFRWRHATDRERWRLGGNSGGTVCGDVDNDGRLDLLTSEIVHWDVGRNSDEAELLFNTGESPLRFDRPGNQETGLARRKPQGTWDEGIITGNLIDFDNDGWLDVYFGGTDYAANRGLLYRQERPRSFQKVPSSLGVDFYRAHGSVVADFDRDGDLDLVVGHSRMRCGQTGECMSPPIVGFFENQLGATSNWVQLELVGGERTNRWAVGAQVKVTADGSTQLQELAGGHGHFGSQNDRLMHFGLGMACTAEVEIRWPDLDLTTQLISVQSGYRYRIVQGEPPSVIN